MPVWTRVQAAFLLAWASVSIRFQATCVAARQSKNFCKIHRYFGVKIRLKNNSDGFSVLASQRCFATQAAWNPKISHRKMRHHVFGEIESDPKKLDRFNSRTEFCNSQGWVLLVSPECAHGCNNEYIHESFFPVVRTSQIVCRNNIPFLIAQRNFPLRRCPSNSLFSTYFEWCHVQPRFDDKLPFDIAIPGLNVKMTPQALFNPLTACINMSSTCAQFGE